MNRTKFSLMLIAIIVICLAISAFAKSTVLQEGDAEREMADGVAETHEAEGVGLPDNLALEYRDAELIKIPPAGDLPMLTKQGERRLGMIDGEEINIDLYSDSNDNVHGIINNLDRKYILRDLGYAHNMDSIEAFDMQLNSQDSEGDIFLVSAVGSDILGYKYVFYDKENNDLLCYHNWGIPEAVDIDNDGTDEVLMQFKGLHNNAPDGDILVFDDGKLTVSGINDAVYNNTGADKGATKAATIFKLQDDRVLVDITIYGDEKFSKLYRLEKEELMSLPQQAQQTGHIVYINDQYNFYFLLPESWKDYSIVTGEWEGQPLEGLEDNDAVETGPVINIRHPEWTEEDPRQDIPVMVFTLDQWDMLQQDKFHIGAAPVGPRELGRNGGFVFALPARYNYAFPTGYEEVESILEDNPLKPLWEVGGKMADSNMQVVEVYYTCSEEAPGGLYPVNRKVSKDVDPVRAALEEMLCGPTKEEQLKGYRSHFSRTTAGMLRSVTRSDDGKTVTINFANFSDLRLSPAPTGSRFRRSTAKCNTVNDGQNRKKSSNYEKRFEDFFMPFYTLFV